jgi:hypothetical protein
LVLFIERLTQLAEAELSRARAQIGTVSEPVLEQARWECPGVTQAEIVEAAFVLYRCWWYGPGFLDWYVLNAPMKFKGKKVRNRKESQWVWKQWLTQTRSRQDYQHFVCAFVALLAHQLTAQPDRDPMSLADEALQQACAVYPATRPPLTPYDYGVMAYVLSECWAHGETVMTWATARGYMVARRSDS